MASSGLASSEMNQLRSELRDLQAEMQRQRADFQRQLDELRQGQSEAAKQVDEDFSSSSEDEKLRGSIVEHVENEISYSLQESIWDVSIFTFSPFIHQSDNLMNLAAFVLNAGLQLAFAYYIWKEFSPLSIDQDTVASYEDWRVQAGHSKKFASPIDGTSLVQRVCAQDATLTAGSSQVTAVGTLAAWISEVQTDAWSREYKVRSGATYWLAILALALWIMTVFAELRSIFQYATATSAIFRPEFRSRMTTAENGVKICYIGSGRLVWALATVLLRCGISLTLLFVGGSWLMNTESASDLILNAAALSFVLDCDELIYSVFCPSSLRFIVENLEPIPFPKSFHKRGSIFVVTCFVALPALVVFFHEAYLGPILDLRRQAYEVLCGGDQLFVTGVDTLDRTYVMYPIVNATMYGDWYEANEPARRLFQVRRELTKNYINYSYEKYYWQPTGMEAYKLQTMSLQEMVSGMDCKDQFSTLDHAYAPLGNESIKACPDTAAYCDDSSAYARAVCPETCGCGDPQRGLVFWQTGCPTACLTSTERKQLLSSPSLLCKDRTPLELKVQPGWDTAVSGLRTFLLREVMGVSNKTRTNEITGSLKDRGCSAIRDRSSTFWREWLNVVNEEQEYTGVSSESTEDLVKFMCNGPFATFCPEACDCMQAFARSQRDEASYFCPTSCAASVI